MHWSIPIESIFTALQQAELQIAVYAGVEQ